MSTIITLVVLLLVIGVALWAINTFVPMEPRIKQILNAVVIIALVVWLLVRFVVPLLKTL